MTVPQFMQRHEVAWNALQHDPMWHDLISTLREFDPARKLPAVGVEDLTKNTNTFLGSISGFNLAVNVLTHGITLDPNIRMPEADYPEDNE